MFVTWYDSLRFEDMITLDLDLCIVFLYAQTIYVDYIFY